MYISCYPVLAAQTKLPFYLSGVGVSDPEYNVVRENGLVSCQILFTRRGKGILHVDGKELIQTPGSIFFVTAGTPHDYKVADRESGWETAWVVFRGAHLQELLTELGFGRWHELSGADLSGCESIFSRILSAVKDPVNGGERCSMLIYEYILEIRSLMITRKTGSGGIISPALERMDEQYMRDITLEELADLCGVSLQHFCRVFRAQTGMRPMEYLARRRMSEAKRLLSSTEHSVTEIAALTGYSSPTYFGTVFRRYEGTTPSEYRRSRVL